MISRCCWAGVIVFMPVGRRRVDPGAHGRLRRAAVARLAAAIRAVIRSWALSRSTVAPYLATNGLVAIRPRKLDLVDRRHQRVGRQQARRRRAASARPVGDRTVTSASPVPSEVIVFSTS